MLGSPPRNCKANRIIRTNKFFEKKARLFIYLSKKSKIKGSHITEVKVVFIFAMEIRYPENAKTIAEKKAEARFSLKCRISQYINRDPRK